MHEVVIATTNPGKVAELRDILGAAGVEVVGLAELGVDIPDPVEDADSFEANALIKARAYAKALGRACLADDSGLEVDALGGSPGVHSARYADADADGPRDARDAANSALLMKNLEGTAEADRAARFVCAMVLVEPGGQIIAEARGTFEGRIGLPPRVPAGEQGFGYDPLFLVAPSFTHTSAELDRAEKNRLSHRGQAARSIAQQLAARDNQ